MFTLSRRNSQSKSDSERVNIWTLNRDVAIKALLLKLEGSLGQGSFEIDTETRVSFQSIFISHPTLSKVRAYLYTYGQAEGCYGVHLEYPTETENTHLYDIYDNVRFARLVDMLAAHLSWSPEPDNQ